MTASPVPRPPHNTGRDPHPNTHIAGALGQVDGVEGPLVTRPPTVTVLASPAGIISCHDWAEVAHRRDTVRRVTALPLCAA